MILGKTALAHQVLKDRSVALTPRQRAALILVDGRRTLDDLLKATEAAGVARVDIDLLVGHGLLEDVAPQRTAAQQARQAAAAAASARYKQRSAQERYADAYPIATQLTAGLGLRGFRLNLAVEAATGYEQLLAVAPRIREAVGAEKYAPLEDALNDR